MSGFSEHFGWLEIVFTAVIALGFGGYQLWSVNREIRADRERAARDRAAQGDKDSSAG
ncbi:hypothetical protein ACFOON_07160 [Novosphingobium piscinae]|uniref:Uncharacterized protein n=1 Tax=Novosphingobium piscinae TaxID=1507448 RepID=A0A7X1FWZ3_9SPHN|nr:hypothetical protein [Novosphingobium piscinae]MBC2668500.1 hypothetical protein [Novosphingobium piscinae]